MSILERTRLRIALVISGDGLDPVDCSRQIGLAPSSSRAKGELRTSARIPSPTGEWIVETEWMPTACIDEGIGKLMSTVWPACDTIKAYCAKNAARVSIVATVEVFDERPDYSMSAFHIRQLADIAADYSIDFYDYSGAAHVTGNPAGISTGSA